MKQTTQERWMEEIPILAQILSEYKPGIGNFVRETHFGKLYLKDEHYTLVKHRG